MRLFIFILFSLLICHCFAEATAKGKRSFIGTQTENIPTSSYVPDSTRTLLYFDGFDADTLGPSWEKHGNLEYYVSANTLKVPVRTLKRSPKSGSLVLNHPLALNDFTIRLSSDQIIPSRNPELSSAFFFFPESSAFGNDGLPETFLRYYKRSQVELVEFKTKENAPKLIWARNQKISGGEAKHIALELNAKNFRMIENDSTIFTLKTPWQGAFRLKMGIWMSTKGISESGGNMVYDNIVLEVNKEPTAN